MEPVNQIHVGLDLYDAVLAELRDHGPLDALSLARRVDRVVAGKVDAHLIEIVTDRLRLVAQRPDGLFDHARRLLDGVVLTHRVRGRLQNRVDLWASSALLPFFAMAAAEPLPLASGGEVRIGETVDPVLLGPPGWLPDTERGSLLALTWSNGRLGVERVDVEDLADPAEDEHVRALIAERCNAESWWSGDDPSDRERQLITALAHARIEDPDLLSAPHAPLDELLYEPFADRERDLFREFAASRQLESVSFSISGMPVALDRELRARAGHYGMTQDQFVIALLGHLAWRTPFAEDIEPWEQWLPEQPTKRRPTRHAPGGVVQLRVRPDNSEPPAG